MPRSIGAKAIDDEMIAFFVAEAGKMPVAKMSEITGVKPTAIYSVLHRKKVRLMLHYTKPKVTKGKKRNMKMAPVHPDPPREPIQRPPSQYGNSRSPYGIATDFHFQNATS